MWMLCWGIPLHAWDMENIKKIASTVGEVVEVDDDVEELQRLDRARVLIKTPWYPIIQHVVAVSINGEEYMVHMAEETCYNSSRCKCWTGSLIGSSEEISSKESEIGTPLLADDVSPKNECSLIMTKVIADKGEPLGEVGELRLTNGQGLSYGPQGNNPRFLTQ